MQLTIPLVDRSISARTLDAHLARVFRATERLRAIQQSGRPSPRPPWWNEHMQDLAWAQQAPMFRMNCRSHRAMYAHWRLQCEVAAARAAYSALSSGIDVDRSALAILRNGETALQAMGDILSPAQLQRRLFYLVVPDASQLNQPIPDIYTPVPISPAEKWLELEEESICGRFMVGEIDRARALDLMKRIRRRLNRLVDDRIRANRRMARFKVLPDRQALAAAMLEDWREIVTGWRLAESAVRDVAELLRGTLIAAPKVDADVAAAIRAAIEQTVAICQISVMGGGGGKSGRRYALFKIGRTWQLTFEGATFPLTDSVGLRYLRYLLQRPSKMCTYAELEREARPKEVPVEDGINEEQASRSELEACQRAADDLQNELDEAVRNSDLAAMQEIGRRQERHRAWMKDLVFRGRVREASPQYKRLQQKVSKAIGRVYEQLGSDHPAVLHLRATIRKDGGMRYVPPAGISWEIW